MADFLYHHKSSTCQKPTQSRQDRDNHSLLPERENHIEEIHCPGQGWLYCLEQEAGEGPGPQVRPWAV